MAKFDKVNVVALLTCTLFLLAQTNWRATCGFSLDDAGRGQVRETASLMIQANETSGRSLDHQHEAGDGNGSRTVLSPRPPTTTATTTVNNPCTNASTNVRAHSTMDEDLAKDAEDSGIRNLRLVFVGDSVTRYQYMSLAYYLRFDRWWDGPPNAPNYLFEASSFRHPTHRQSWNEFFYQSHHLLYPFEACDCVRDMKKGSVNCERRYFRDPRRNNTLVFINLNGNDTRESWGFYGHFTPQKVWSNFDSLVDWPVGFGALAHVAEKEIERWEYATWGEVLRYHVGPLLGIVDTKNGTTSTNVTANTTTTTTGTTTKSFSTAVILNAGLHPHNFDSAASRENLHDALHELGVRSIWKTTTLTLNQVQNHAMKNLTHDVLLCQLLDDCFDVKSWMGRIKPEYYSDRVHFREPVYRVMNEDLLRLLGHLPDSYIPLDRTTLLSEEK